MENILKTPEAPKEIYISYQGVKHRIPVDNIVYIESQLRKLIIHTVKADYYCYGKMDDFERELDGCGFVRCHQSYLVASSKILSYDKDSVHLSDVNIPVSRRYYKETNEVLKGKNPSGNLERHASSNIDCGVFHGIKGEYKGSRVQFFPEQQILIGRDGTQADIIINIPTVSRIHCSLTYHGQSKEYELTDYSSNGIFVNGNKRLLHEDTYLLKKGTEISLGSENVVFRLE